MRVRVDELREQTRRLQVDVPLTDFPALAELVEGWTIIPRDHIKGELTASLAGDIIRVAGELRCTVGVGCSRCLEMSDTLLVVPVMLCYTRGSAAADAEAPSAERELTEDELGLIFFEGDQIDIRADLEQEIVMALPERHLCSESCAGLCPQCGVNLNVAGCDCEKPVFHSGLAALKNFKPNK